IEHAVAGIDGIDLGRASFQEAIGKPAGAATQIRANEAGHINRKSSQRVLQFEPAAGDEWRRWIGHAGTVAGVAGVVMRP
ncbi:MAG: hypothetical protein JWM57_1600, partial [Phycisphaerales bacterium]|nr:hypothetical protein [Phycisphaerales bacterium]